MKRRAYLLCLVLLSLFATEARAAPITFQFDTTMDTSAFGGGPGVPLTVVYTFDSELPNGSGPFGVGSYGPLAMQIQLGDETASASGGGIILWNQGDTDNTDGYDVRPDFFSFSGQLLGRDIEFFRFLLVDEDANMFSDTALPLSPDFAVAADFQQTEISFADGGGGLFVTDGPWTPLAERTPFTLTQVPEPSTFVLAVLGILGLIVLRKCRRSARGAVMAALCVLVSMVGPARGNPLKYEPAADPSVGFNLISWQNFRGSGPSAWTISVQSLYNAGFRQVSINPVRYFDPNTGTIAATSQNGPELSHIAAGIARAKSLGMTVTVTPFVEFQNFTQWRAYWDPSPGSASSNQFWSGYQQYLTDVARVAQIYGADFMNVGTELRGLVQNPGNNAHWNAAINAVAANFSGQLGYAANWDDFKDDNLTNAIWNHPAIDYMGVDAYFPTATTEQADASGSNPNPAFIGQLTDNWNAQLDGNILPFAHSLKGGNGMPVVFSETGLVAYNRTTATPWDVMLSNPDQGEQIMGFNALLAATDHRKAKDNLLAMYIWQWGMPGSAGSIWNMAPTLPADQPLNVPATQYLADFITHPIPEPSTIVLAALSLIGLAARCWRSRPNVGVAALTVLLLSIVAADAHAISIDTVPVGDVGNANDPLTGNLYGGVGYAYRIGTTEVTNAQYAAFLNEKAKSDPLALYITLMGSEARGGITRSGVSGAFTYATRANMADKPVNYVSWYDSIRFASSRD